VKAGDVEFLYLTTTGRKTGQPREIEIWFTEHAGRYYVISEHLEEAHWVQNLRADPRVRVRVGAAGFDARARVVDAGDEGALSATARELSEKKYGWGDGLVVELNPTLPAAP
jgi:deazaflavin-dependent oxidoreductase (nitroreductase family)